MFEWDILSEGCKEFFRKIVLDILKDREVKQIVRLDIIHLLMEAKKGKLSDNVVKSDEANTESAKFEQSALTTRQTENELIRLWHPSIILDRECNRDYDLGKPNKDADKDFIIKKGTKIMIPIHAIHRDPQYFSNPEKFDPERFSAENKQKMHPSAYIPFGIGPRNCIGLRLGLCEMKAITYQILLNMEVLQTETTCIPAQLCPTFLSLKLEGGHTLRFRLRAHT